MVISQGTEHERGISDTTYSSREDEPGHLSYNKASTPTQQNIKHSSAASENRLTDYPHLLK